VRAAPADPVEASLADYKQRLIDAYTGERGVDAESIGRGRVPCEWRASVVWASNRAPRSCASETIRFEGKSEASAGAAEERR
jgi:hypothetical protein